MAQEMGDVEHLSMTGDIRRQVAPRCLLMPGDGSSELVLLAAGVTQVDVVAGIATRLRIARHMRHHPDAQVTIVPPSDPVAAERYVEMLTPLPDGVSIAGGELPTGATRFALVPATPIVDESAAIAAAAFALEACDAARVSHPRANLAALAVAELSSNAIRYSVGSQDSAIVAATVRGRARTLEVAVTDLGRGLSEAADVLRLVREIPGASGGTGGLADLIRQGQRHKIDVSIEVLAGTARLRWTWSSHRTERLAYIPGTTVVVRIPT